MRKGDNPLEASGHGYRSQFQLQRLMDLLLKMRRVVDAEGNACMYSCICGQQNNRTRGCVVTDLARPADHFMRYKAGVSSLIRGRAIRAHNSNLIDSHIDAEHECFALKL